MKKSSELQLLLLKKQVKYRFDRLSEYAAVLERLLNEEIAKEISLGVTSFAAAKSRDPFYEVKTRFAL